MPQQLDGSVFDDTRSGSPGDLRTIAAAALGNHSVPHRSSSIPDDRLRPIGIPWLLTSRL